ncbi:MAG: hypothetical protein KFB93_08900 [Simkaniaceae bacterium]|nr:MAG: hypothetical protein KFB93_08900 [Simkaniaceae bacterium]
MAKGQSDVDALILEALCGEISSTPGLKALFIIFFHRDPKEHGEKEWLQSRTATRNLSLVNKIQV